jgi:hypothetical protein
MPNNQTNIEATTAERNTANIAGAYRNKNILEQTAKSCHANFWYLRDACWAVKKALHIPPIRYKLRGALFTRATSIHSGRRMPASALTAFAAAPSKSLRIIYWWSATSNIIPFIAVLM